jgi:3-oxoacyl-[acyl-carrier protein] reductase
LNLEGRVALVTGAGRGIGRATAGLLHDLGARIVACDIDKEPLAEAVTAIGEGTISQVCDITDKADVDAAVTAAVDTFAKLDILVNCAGILRDGRIYEVDETNWNDVLRSHLNGAFLCVQAAQRVMVKQRYGKIVLVSSLSARGNIGQAAYSAAKAGIQGFARTAAMELGKYGITVNCVAPGFVVTRMAQERADKLGVSYEDMKAAMEKSTALRRVAEPIDIARVIAFLASDYSGYVTGQTIYAIGGP